MLQKADAVFEIGGVKGIGLVGAVYEVEKAGYEFENLAGTSAGAIVASLLADGTSEPHHGQQLASSSLSRTREPLKNRIGVRSIIP